MIINRRSDKAGLYIHIPFCLKKCRYCGFLSFGTGPAEQGQSPTGRKAEGREKLPPNTQTYMNVLIEEIHLQGSGSQGQKPVIDTIFIGGGTPSLIDPEQMEAVLNAVRDSFSIERQAEITIEANPKTLTEDKLSAYKRMGINRLSIGAQSMDNGLLSVLGRVHTREDFLENFQAARETGFDNINVDLMLGLPGQTMDMWEDSLCQVLDLSPEHISFYSLQLEEGSDFYRMYKEGSLELPSEELDRRMYHRGIEMVKAAGYHHYEISNSAKPGFECKHNLKYWNFDQYKAAGLGAHSFCYDQGRCFHTEDLDEYIQKVQTGHIPIIREQESAREYMGEYVFTALRKTEGMDTSDFQKTFGTDFFQVYGDKLEMLLTYREKGLLILEEGRIALTEKGIDCSNRIMAEFV